MSIGYIKEELHLTKVFNVINEGTIIAIATPVGRGAIGLIRLSGPESIAKTNMIIARMASLGTPTGQFKCLQILIYLRECVDQLLHIFILAFCISPGGGKESVYGLYLVATLWFFARI